MSRGDEGVSTDRPMPSPHHQIADRFPGAGRVARRHRSWGGVSRFHAQSTRRAGDVVRVASGDQPLGSIGRRGGVRPDDGHRGLFGGGAGTSYFDDTWTWNGSTWTEQFPPTSPGARFDATMSYDPATGDLVLFGGYDLATSSTGLDDTWTWNGTTWTEQAPATSPPARWHASMTYDSTAGDVVLFGGYGDGEVSLDDTWTWNGSTWTEQFPATSPPARGTAAMADDPAAGDVVLFGGDLDNHDYVNDTWTWNGTTWTEQSPAASPSAWHRGGDGV